MLTESELTAFISQEEAGDVGYMASDLTEQRRKDPDYEPPVKWSRFHGLWMGP